jgi:hypothetical protein
LEHSAGGDVGSTRRYLNCLLCRHDLWHRRYSDPCILMPLASANECVRASDAASGGYTITDLQPPRQLPPRPAVRPLNFILLCLMMQAQAPRWSTPPAAAREEDRHVHTDARGRRTGAASACVPAAAVQGRPNRITSLSSIQQSPPTQEHERVKQLVCQHGAAASKDFYCYANTCIHDPSSPA